MDQERLWNRNFILAMLTGGFAAMVMYTLITTMAVYSMNTFGVSEGMAGFISSIAMLGGIFGRLFAANYMDRIGRRKLAFIASALHPAVCVLYFLPGSLGSVLALRLLHGIVCGCLHNVMATSVIDFIPPARRAEGIAFYTLSFSFGIAVGPPVAMYVIGAFSYQTLWIVNLVLAIVAFVILACIRFVPVTFGGEKATRSGKFSIGGLFEKSALPLALMIIFLSLCYMGLPALLETYTIRIGIAWVAPIFFVIFSVFIVVTRPIAGRLVDKRGENFVFVPSIMLFSASFVVLGLAGAGATSAAVLIIVAAFMVAASYGTILPLGQAVCVKYAEPRQFGKITSTYFIFSDLGMGTGALIFGFVASKTGFSNMFFLCALIVFATLAVYWRLHGRHHRAAPSTIKNL
ncbi:MAG: MFS transporter [Clostridiales bacterium]|nr:MFS transporter [Clostridiales bacterium]